MFSILVDFLWAPYESNLTEVLRRQQETRVPDVLVMGSGLWHMIQYSLFGSILTVGAMVGAIMSGHIADIIGRKRAMAFSDIFCIIGWLAIIFGKDSWWLDLGWLSIGYGIGLLAYVVLIYIAKITPKNIRGAFTTVNQVTWQKNLT